MRFTLFLTTRCKDTNIFKKIEYFFKNIQFSNNRH